MTLIDRPRPRGTPGVWNTAGHALGPEGSYLRATLFRAGAEECADVEEVIPVRPGTSNGDNTKRRLVRLLGEHAHARAVAWMEGYVAGRTPRAAIVQQARVKRKPKSTASVG